MGRSIASYREEAGHQVSPLNEVHGGEAPRVEYTEDGAPESSRSQSGRALVQGHRERKHKAHSLIDKVYLWQNLHTAWRRVRRNKGAHGLDRVSIHQFEADLEKHLREIQRKLMERRYTPLPVRRVYIPKTSNPKERRPLGIPVVADRVVGQALLQVLDPLFDHEMSDRSFAYRKGRNAHGAITAIMQAEREGYRSVVDADVKSFFDQLDHEVVMSRVRARIADGRVLDLIEAFLKAGVYEDGVVSVPSRGCPQGGVISPWLANLVLDDLDKALEARGYHHVRYADDFVVLCRSRQEAEQARAFVAEVLEVLELTLHEEKTRVVDFRAGFEFLGFRFRNWRIGIRPKAIDRFKDSVRSRTRRQQGRNVEAVIQDLNPVLRGFAQYFGSAEVTTLYRRLDAWVRMRIRSFKMQRRCFHDNHRLPGSRLAKWGLLSLQECRPVQRFSFTRASISESRSGLLAMRKPHGVAQWL